MFWLLTRTPIFAGSDPSLAEEFNPAATTRVQRPASSACSVISAMDSVMYDTNAVANPTAA